MCRDAELDKELESLDDSQRRAARELLALRDRAVQLSTILGIDPDEVVHMLRQLRRTPSERLLLGLRHGRLLNAANRR